MTPAKPILVTGSHRSGSTWVGKMICASSEAGYVYEPFNLTNARCPCGFQAKYWFTYVCKENEREFTRHLEHVMAFRGSLPGELAMVRTPKDLGRLMRDRWIRRRHRAHHARPLVKDPLALLSAEWMADKYNMDVLVLIRHPAAFASSLKLLNWRFDFHHFLDQPLLMRDMLGPFETEIRAQVDREHDIIDQSILLWRILHQAIADYRSRHPEWLFIRHEDLSIDPIGGYQEIFERFNLTFTDQVRCVIERHSDTKNPAEQTQGIHSLKRDSKASIKNWKKRLSAQEIERLCVGTRDVSDKFYSQDDW